MAEQSGEGEKLDLRGLTNLYQVVAFRARHGTGPEGVSLEQERRNVYSQIVDVTAGTLLEHKGEGGRNLLEGTLRSMHSAKEPPPEIGDFYLRVACKVAEIASQPQSGSS